MKAAFGRVSITPPINDTFPDLFFDPEGTLDEIYARVAILEADSGPIVLVTARFSLVHRATRVHGDNAALVREGMHQTTTFLWGQTLLGPGV